MVKVKCIDEETESTSELGRKEQGENVIMVETEIEIKFDEEFLTGISVVK